MTDPINNNSTGGNDIPSAHPVGTAGTPSIAKEVHHHHHGGDNTSKKRGFFTGICKVGVLFSVAVGCLVIGVYTGLFTALTQGSSLVKTTYQEGTGEERVVIVPVEGIITSDTAYYMRTVVHDILRDETIKAVVLRVDSGGGSVSASDQIWDMIKRLKAERDIPVVASYGGYAASGGYYISAGSDYIYAEPTTITGSIGVIAQAFTMESLMIDKLGIKPEIITSSLATKKEVANNPFRAWTEEDRKAIRERIDPMHERFIDIVFEGRKNYLSRDQVLPLATGEVFSGTDAVEKKLVDEVGYIDEAIEKAIELGGFADASPPVMMYYVKPSLLDMVGVSQQTPARGQVSRSLQNMNINGETIRTWMNELATPQMMYLINQK